jgi:hypothetical protein
MYPEVQPSYDLRLKLVPEYLTVLNVGIGKIIPSLLARQLPLLPFKRLDHLECYEPYIDLAKTFEWACKDVRYILGNAEEFTGYADYDLVLLFDVLEHMKKEEGIRILERCPHALVFGPVDTMISEAHEENPEGDPHARHISLWEPADFGIGWEVEVLKDFHDFGWRKMDALWAMK